jgi:integrase
MLAMPRPRPPHLHRETNRHGNTVWYFRNGHGPRIRLHAAYGTPEFLAGYEAALSGSPLPAPGKAAPDSLQWLYEQYRAKSSEWAALSGATKRQRENIFQGVMQAAGTEKFRAVSKRAIIAGRDRRKDTPAQARNFLDAMRGLFRWALDAGHVKADPTAGIKNPKRPRGAGFKIWTEDDVERYEARWPVGTKERVWLDVLLYSGLRRGDAVELGPQHVRDGVATLRTEKSQGETTVTIPILPVLAATLEAGPCGSETFICGARGGRLTKESFGNVFKEACVAAGVIESKKAAHGLRKVGATRAANNGATVAELEAIFGWSGGGMASLYTKAADRARLSKGAMTKLEKSPSIPAPHEKVRDIGEKA